MPTYKRHSAGAAFRRAGICGGLAAGLAVLAFSGLAPLNMSKAQADEESTGFAPSLFYSFRESLKKATPRFDFGIWASDLEKALTAYEEGNFTKAHKLFKAAADDGDLMASWWLGRMYQLGQGVPASDSEAFVHFQKAAKAFDGTERKGPLFRAKLDSLVQVGRYYRTGIEGTKVEKLPWRAIRIFRKAAQYRHPGAQFGIGDMMYDGVEIPERKQRGLRWIMLAARKHYPPAQAKLGEIFWKRQQSKDQIQALMWYTLATTASQPEHYPEIYDRYEELSTVLAAPEREQAQEMAINWSRSYPRPITGTTQPAGN